MKKKLMVLSSFVLFLAPVVVGAQQADTSPGTIGYIIMQIGGIINMIVPILVTIAVLYFIWGVIKYVISGDEEAKKKARDMIIYGIIGITIIVAMWGFVNLLTRSLGINEGAIYTPPTIFQ